MPDLTVPFFRYIFKDKSCLSFLLVSVLITVIYFILLRILFPVASFYFDSGTYMDAAARGLEVSLRPIGYSNLIGFFHAISPSDGLLIFAQYISNVIANLFLFFTLLYFFSLKKFYRVVLFIFLMCNPLYVLYSNYVMSDAFFCSLSVLWFTVLLWIIYRPLWMYFFIQLFLLYWLFLLRYNAIVYPFIVAVAYLLSKQLIWKKVVSIGITFLVIFGMMHSITHKTEKATGIAVFSAFSGWQLANNSMFVLKHVRPDSSVFKTQTSKELCALINHYYNSLNTKEPDPLVCYGDVHPMFIWNTYSPLKLYINRYLHLFYAQHPPHRYISSWTGNGPVYKYDKQNIDWLTTWNIMGPVYEEFGHEVIIKYPLSYFCYFMWPNFKYFCNPSVELYNYYNNNADTLEHYITAYYHFSSNKINQSHAYLLPVLMGPWSWLFTIINILFFLLAAIYYFTCRYINDALFNRYLIFYIVFYLSNFTLGIATAPTYFRYYIVAVTLSMTYIICLWQRVFNKKKLVYVYKQHSPGTDS